MVMTDVGLAVCVPPGGQIANLEIRVLVFRLQGGDYSSGGSHPFNLVVEN